MEVAPFSLAWLRRQPYCDFHPQLLGEKSSLSGWAGTFAEARRALDAPVVGYCTQLFDGALTPEAACLFDAAWKGDVFGGMGSWNDVQPTDDYAEVSDALRAALKDAFEAAINAP